MARLSPVHQNIFGENSDNNGQFGSARAGTKITTLDPAEIMELPAWGFGWADAVITGQKLPTLEEMQGTMYVATYQIAYILEQGIPEWNEDTTYYVGSTVKDPGTSTVYNSIANNNVGNPLTDTTKWAVAPYANRPGVPSGRYVTTPLTGSLGTGTFNTGNVYASPIFLERPYEIQSLAFGVNGSSSSLNVKMGVYTDQGGAPGDLISGTAVTGGPYTDVSDTNHTIALGAPITLQPGWYWVAFTSDVNQSLKATTTGSTTSLIGATSMIQAGGQVSKAFTFASSLPASFGTPDSYGTSQNMPFLGFLV